MPSGTRLGFLTDRQVVVAASPTWRSPGHGQSTHPSGLLQPLGGRLVAQGVLDAGTRIQRVGLLEIGGAVPQTAPAHARPAAMLPVDRFHQVFALRCALRTHPVWTHEGAPIESRPSRKPSTYHGLTSDFIAPGTGPDQEIRWHTQARASLN